MNFEQVERRNQDIISNALSWARGEDCSPLEQLDVAMLGECLNIRIPKCFDKFVYSESRNRVKLYGSEKTIYKTLDKLADELLNSKYNSN